MLQDLPDHGDRVQQEKVIKEVGAVAYLGKSIRFDVMHPGVLNSLTAGFETVCQVTGISHQN